MTSGVELVPLDGAQMAVVRHGYDVWNAEGPAGMAREVWDPEIVWHDPPDFPDAATVRGADAVEAHLRERMATLGRSPVRVERASATPDGEVVLIELALDTGGRTSGVRLELWLYHVVCVRHGRPVEVREFLDDRDRALAAVAEKICQTRSASG